MKTVQNPFGAVKVPIIIRGEKRLLDAKLFADGKYLPYSFDYPIKTGNGNSSVFVQLKDIFPGTSYATTVDGRKTLPAKAEADKEFTEKAFCYTLPDWSHTIMFFRPQDLNGINTKSEFEQFHL
ncbi:MAG: hypothetical protein ABIH83_00520 [Candidatus Micrarchaeota archaeon]